MPDKLKKLCIFAESGRLIALAIAAGMVLGMVGPTSAQFFNWGGFQQRPLRQRDGGFSGGWFGGDTFAPFQRPAPQPRWNGRQTLLPVQEDFSKAPPPEKRNTVPERHILVLGDAMVDWLAYGLEDAYAEQPDIGVIRKHKTVSGLIKYQPKGGPADWPAAAKGILATEKADVIVVMLGLDDRRTRRATRRTPSPNLMASLQTKNPLRSPMAQPRRWITNCRQTTVTHRRLEYRKKARARQMASMSFARNPGSNSTKKRSKR
jgi:hypothetical protein